MALKDLIATDAEKHAACLAKVDHLRALLRDVYDVLAVGETPSEGLLSRVRAHMDRGN